MGRACGMYRRRREMRVWKGKLNERYHLEDLGVLVDNIKTDLRRDEGACTVFI